MALAISVFNAAWLAMPPLLLALAMAACTAARLLSSTTGAVCPAPAAGIKALIWATVGLSALAELGV